MQLWTDNPSWDQGAVFRFVRYKRKKYIIVNFSRIAIIRLPLLVATRHSWQGRPVQNDINDVELFRNSDSVQDLGNMSAAERSWNGSHPKAFAMTVIGL